MSSAQSTQWEQVYQQEIEQIAFRRDAEQWEAKKRGVEYDPAGKDDFAGLALSGGGIRSATFALGVLEGLKELELLKKIDYLSTVSGGGYIGAWLSANCKRAADRNSVTQTTHSSSTQLQPDWLDVKADWKKSISHLRRYSNYLSPKVGFFSADTWTMAAIWMRNTVLIQLTVFLAIAMALMVPRGLYQIFQDWPGADNWRWTTVALFILAISGIAGNQLRLNREGEAPLLVPGIGCGG